MEVTLSDPNCKIEFHLSFNARPTQMKRDMSFGEPSFVVGAENQKFIQHDYSMKFMLTSYNSLDCTIRVNFKGLRNARQIDLAPRFEKIDYFEFKQLKVNLPVREPEARCSELEERNLKLLRVYNPNFRTILSKRGVVEHQFKKEMVLGRKNGILEARRKHAEDNVDKFIKRKERD